MSKPILSELEYNADDVASAILQQADLSITNEDLGITDFSSSITFTSPYSEYQDIQAYAFNGFAFVSFGCYASGSSISHGDEIATISNSDFHPNVATNLLTMAWQGDTAERVLFQTNGEIIISGPVDVGSDANYYILINGWYRYTSV